MKIIKTLVQAFFKAFGYKINKLNKLAVVNNNQFTMQAAIKRCVKRGLNVNTVIDIGASDGRWSRACMNYIPNANYFLVEAQLAHKQRLEKLKVKYQNIDYLIAAAGKENGIIYFDDTNLFGGLASESKINEDFKEMPVVSLDSELEKRKLKPPYLLKLDTHGFEVPILEGAKKALKGAELVIIETYNYKLTKDSLKYFEMCTYMEGLGFASIEMVDLMLREYDQSFWQMDTFFVPKTNKEFLYNSYK